MQLSTSLAWCLGSSARPARGSPTCTIRNGRESRSSSVMCRGIISRMFGTLAVQVGQELGEADGVIVFDPSAFPKKGTKSVGVARQWCGRLGKVENCQVGVYMAYVTRKEHAIVNARLYLPEEWTKNRSASQGSWSTQDDQVSDPPSTGVGDVGGVLVAYCRTPGSRATTRWAVPAVFGWNLRALERTLSAWRSPRTH